MLGDTVASIRFDSLAPGSRFAIVGKLDIRIWDANTYQLLRNFEGFGKRNPITRDSWTDSTEEEIIDAATRGVHCPALPDSSSAAAELKLAAAASRLPS